MEQKIKRTSARSSQVTVNPPDPPPRPPHVTQLIIKARRPARGGGSEDELPV